MGHRGLAHKGVAQCHILVEAFVSVDHFVTVFEFLNITG